MNSRFTDLRPVEEFIAARVVSVDPGPGRPRRRLGGPVAALGVTAAAAGLAIALTSGRPESAPALETPRPAAAPPPRRAKINVESDPPGARVLLDGQPRCLTPCTLDAPAGDARVVTIEKEGYLPWWTLVVPGDPAPARARLRRQPLPEARWGVVTFHNAAPANLLVDGKPVGYATSVAHPLALPPGEHRVTLVPPGAAAGGREVAVTVKPGGATEVDVGP